MSQPGQRGTAAIEWPTLLLLLACYGLFAALTLLTPLLPFWLVLPLGAALVCLHGSLQHEALHGHPTRSARLNELLASPALGLWYPYRRYARTHRQHHRNDLLTDPAADPESWYMPPERWAATPPLLRAVYRLNNTLAGRLAIGPLLSVARFYPSELRLVLSGDREVRTAWLLHLPAMGLTLLWVVGVAGIPLWQYLLLYAYPGASLLLLRSYCEHQAHAAVPERTIIVESGPLMSLLFLNNNLHAAHHAAPGLAWYRLPAYYRQRRGLLLAENGGYLARGYGEIFRRYLFRAKEEVRYPL